MTRLQAVVASASIASLVLGCGEEASPPLGPNTGAGLSAATQVNRRAPGQFARAEFHTADECTTTNVDLAALARSGEKIASVAIDHFNFCTFEGFFTQSEDVAATVFETSGDLRSARLEATIPTRVAGSEVQVQVDITWSGSGALEILSGGQLSLDPADPSGCKFVFADQTTIRQGTATGTVSIGSVNYTPDPSNSGLIARSTTSSIGIRC